MIFSGYKIGLKTYKVWVEFMSIVWYNRYKDIDIEKA